MKKIGIVLFCIMFVRITIASDLKPEYCEENYVMPSCNPELIAMGDENLQGLLNFGEEFNKKQFKDNLRRTAIIKLLAQKRELLAPYPDLYPHTKGKNKLYHEGLGYRKFTVAGHDEFSYEDTEDRIEYTGHEIHCYQEDETLRKGAHKMDNEFDDYRKDLATDKNRLNILASMVLGAVAAEEGIEQRPHLSEQIEDKSDEIEKIETIVQNGIRGQVSVSYRSGMAHSTSPCFNQFGNPKHESKACQAFKKELEKMPDTVAKLKREIEIAKHKRNLIDETIFANGFYTKPTDIVDSTTNFFGNLVKSEKNEYVLGKYKKSEFLEGSLKELRKSQGDKFLNQLVGQIKNSNDFAKGSGGVSGVEYALSQLKSILEKNPKITDRLDSLFKSELKEQVTQTDESIAAICKSDGEGLHHIKNLVKASEEEYLKLANDELGKEANIQQLLSSHQKSHCASLKEEYDGRWFQNSIGISGLMGTQLGAGVVALGTGVASAFGCVPCIPIALGAGSVAAGAGFVETKEFSRKRDVMRGLANIDLAKQEDVREALRDAQLGWAFVGLDVVTAPLGLGGGKMLKAGKMVSNSRKSLKGSGLDGNKNFFKTLITALPEDDYLRIMKEIKKLPLAQQKIIAEQLQNLQKVGILKPSTNAAENLTRITKVLADQGVHIPSGKQLNNRVLQQIDNDPNMILTLQSRYAKEMNELKIDPKGSEAQAFVRLVGILERKGCAGFCQRPIRDKQEVVKEFNKHFRSCGGKKKI